MEVFIQSISSKAHSVACHPMSLTTQLVDQDKSILDLINYCVNIYDY